MHAAPRTLLPSDLLVRLAGHSSNVAHHDANVTLCQLGRAGKTKDVDGRGSASLLEEVSKLIDTSAFVNVIIVAVCLG